MITFDSKFMKIKTVDGHLIENKIIVPDTTMAYAIAYNIVGTYSIMSIEDYDCCAASGAFKTDECHVPDFIYELTDLPNSMYL